MNRLVEIGNNGIVAKEQGIKREAVLFNATNSYRKRLKKRGILDGNVLIAIKLEDEE